MQQTIRVMMNPADILETVIELAVSDPDLMRVTLQACVPSPVNLQSSRA